MGESAYVKTTEAAWRRAEGGWGVGVRGIIGGKN